MSFRRGQLRYFVTVAEEGQITRAAAKLQIAQPALSHAIAQLESELGVELLERHPRGVTLTAAGEVFVAKAREVLAKEQDAALMAQSLARAANGVVEVGFVGAPPTLTNPELFAAFARAAPEAQVSLRDLPFPCGSTVSWLEQVDVAFCHPPSIEARVRVQAVRVEPRALMAHKSHPLAQRSRLTVADVLDETFVSYHPDVQPGWAGFHSLDDHRGGPPRRTTVDHAASTMQMVGIMTSSRAVAIAPLCDANVGRQILPDVVATPLHDAQPMVISLVWDEDRQHPLTHALAQVAMTLAGAAGATGAAPAAAPGPPTR
jgi:DNA-binding transcriptional LysR family regulator